MNKADSIKYFDKINVVLRGSKSIIDVIDLGKEFNRDKAIKASLLNSISLAECLKEILKEIVETDCKNKKDKDFSDVFGDMFNKK